jgi:hypothetical protein
MIQIRHFQMKRFRARTGRIMDLNFTNRNECRQILRLVLSEDANAGLVVADKQLKPPVAISIDQTEEPAQPPVIENHFSFVEMVEQRRSARADILQPVELEASVRRAVIVVTRMRQPQQIQKPVTIPVGKLERGSEARKRSGREVRVRILNRLPAGSC